MKLTLTLPLPTEGICLLCIVVTSLTRTHFSAVWGQVCQFTKVFVLHTLSSLLLLISLVSEALLFFLLLLSLFHGTLHYVFLFPERHAFLMHKQAWAPTDFSPGKHNLTLGSSVIPWKKLPPFPKDDSPNAQDLRQAWTTVKWACKCYSYYLYVKIMLQVQYIIDRLFSHCIRKQDISIMSLYFCCLT